MFKKLFFLIPVLFFSFSMSAQNDFKIGLHGGLNFPDVWGNEYAKYQDFKIGYLVGVSFEQPIIKNWTIKANLNYEPEQKISGMPIITSIFLFS